VGDSANDLLAFVADPNVSIMESKALTADIRAGRHDGGRRLAAEVKGAAARESPDPRRDLPRVGSHPAMPMQEPPK